IRSLLLTIQGRLLDTISVALSRTLYSYSRTDVIVSRGNVINNPNQVSQLSDSALVQLALQTLVRYNFKVAVSSLMRILRDPSLPSYHQKSLGLGCVPYLPK
ncbi:hypothetical protein MKX03_017731, partial [Papaver bracteatum]